MSVRQLLQTEIWSNRTTRRMLVWSGTLLGFVIAVLAILILVERYWLTSGEQRAGRAALAQIDGLENFESMSVWEFDAKSYKAQALIDDAKKSAWTWRDKGVAESLSYYLDLIKIDEEYAEDEKLIDQKFPGRFPRDPQMANESTAVAKEGRALLRHGLHEILD